MPFKDGKQRSQAKIYKHPQREQIEKEIVDGVPYREISRRWGMSVHAVSMYANRRLRDLLRHSEKAKGWDGDRIISEIESALEKAQKMLDACDEWLTDPENPEKYNLDPRGDEIEVVYYYEGKKRKGRLQDVLDFLADNGVNPIEVKHKRADPRKLLLEAVERLGAQVERIARTRGDIADVTINLYQSQTWIQFQQLVLESLRDHPEAREDLADRLRASGLIDESSVGDPEREEETG